MLSLSFVILYPLRFPPSPVCLFSVCLAWLSQFFWFLPKLNVRHKNKICDLGWLDVKTNNTVLQCRAYNVIKYSSSHLYIPRGIVCQDKKRGGITFFTITSKRYMYLASLHLVHPSAAYASNNLLYIAWPNTEVVQHKSKEGISEVTVF